MVYEKGRLLLEFGSRFDISDDHATQWSPRLGASFHLYPDTRVRVSAGRAFKLPSFFALASPGALGGNPDLRPEKALGGDLGINHRFSDSGWQMGLTYFRNRFEDLVDFDFDLFTHLNRSRVDSEGFEFSLAWNKAVPYPLTFKLHGSKRTIPVPINPCAIGPSGAARQVGMAPQFQLVLSSGMPRPFPKCRPQIPVQFRFVTAGYTVFGLSASAQISPRWQARARIDNLTDKTYESLIGFPGPTFIQVGDAVFSGPLGACFEALLAGHGMPRDAFLRFLFLVEWLNLPPAHQSRTLVETTRFCRCTTRCWFAVGRRIYSGALKPDHDCTGFGLWCGGRNPVVFTGCGGRHLGRVWIGPIQ